MGYYYCIAECLRCKNTFMCNPDRVPSIRVNGTREPLCKNCFKLLNSIRKDRGIEEWIMPTGAYEPVNENPEMEIFDDYYDIMKDQF